MYDQDTIQDPQIQPSNLFFPLPESDAYILPEFDHNAGSGDPGNQGVHSLQTLVELCAGSPSYVPFSLNVLDIRSFCFILSQWSVTLHSLRSSITHHSLMPPSDFPIQATCHSNSRYNTISSFVLLDINENLHRRSSDFPR